MRKTIYVSIGNSDDKLSQREWSEYYEETDDLVGFAAAHVHGRWLSGPADAYQNACWCVELPLDKRDAIRDELRRVARPYGQESIAWSEADTEFLFAAALSGGTPEPTDGSSS